MRPVTFQANAITRSRGFTGLFVFVAGRIIPVILPRVLAFGGQRKRAVARAENIGRYSPAIGILQAALYVVRRLPHHGTSERGFIRITGRRCAGRFIPFVREQRLALCLLVPLLRGIGLCKLYVLCHQTGFFIIRFPRWRFLAWVPACVSHHFPSSALFSPVVALTYTLSRIRYSICIYSLHLLLLVFHHT